MAKQQQAINDDQSAPLSYAFDANAAPGSALSYEQLQSRRKIAETLAGRQLGYPKNIGEGIYAGAKGLTDAYSERQVAEADAARDLAIRAAAARNATFPVAGEAASGAPPPAAVLPPQPSPSPSPSPPPPPLAPQVSDAAPAGAPPPPPMAFADAAPPAPDGLPPGGQPLPGPPGVPPPAPDQVMAGRDALAQAMAANPHPLGTDASNLATRLPPMVPMPAAPAAPLPAPGGGAQPPFGGSGTTARSDPGNPAILSSIKPANELVTYPEMPKQPGAIPPGREQRFAMAQLAAAPTDPYNVALWKPIVDNWEADRLRRSGLAKELYDKQLTEYLKSQEQRRDRQANEPIRQQTFKKGQLEVPYEPPAGANAAQQDPGLGTPQSQQRKGYPDLGPIPPNVIPAQHIAARQKEMTADIQAAQKADQTVPETLQLVHDIRTHKGKESALGFFGAAAEGLRGSSANDFAKLVDRAQGGAFLQAYSIDSAAPAQISNAEGSEGDGGDRPAVDGAEQGSLRQGARRFRARCAPRLRDGAAQGQSAGHGLPRYWATRPRWRRISVNCRRGAPRDTSAATRAIRATGSRQATDMAEERPWEAYDPPAAPSSRGR
jgi:hypothetical protein